MLQSTLALFASLALGVAAAPHVTRATGAGKVYEFTDGTSIQNVAVRYNGELLLTTANPPRVYGLNPLTANPTPRLLFELNTTTYNTISGIAEYIPEQFAVVAHKYDAATASATNNAVFTFNASQTAITPRRAASLSRAGHATSATWMYAAPATVMVSDAKLGAIWRVDLVLGIVVKTIDDASVLGVDTSVSSNPMGVSGVKTWGNDAYVVNANRMSATKLPINVWTGVVNGNITALGSLPNDQRAAQGYYDDFVVDDWSGNLWIASPPESVNVILKNGTQTTVANGITKGTAGTGPTAVAFGRLVDMRVVYVVTGGGEVYAIDAIPIPISF